MPIAISSKDDFSIGDHIVFYRGEAWKVTKATPNGWLHIERTVGYFWERKKIRRVVRKSDVF